MSKKRILVSGCGMSWSGQEEKTWANVFLAVGADLIDVSGPAVSNQWILNKAIDYLLNNSVTDVIIQLTGIGKLEVDVSDNNRKEELVNKDSIRNFTINDIWPSSKSTDHISKKLYYDWLYSPSIEVEDITCKLNLIKYFCSTQKINLFVYQGYEIPWRRDYLKDLIINFNDPWYNNYKNSSFYNMHNHNEKNTVPVLEYQISLSLEIANTVDPSLIKKIQKIQKHYQS
jgi:hypothetical protein